MSAHYRSKQNFTWEALEAAKSALGSLKNNLALFDKKGKVDKKFKEKFIAVLQDDFNISQAVAIIWEILKSNLNNGDKRATILDFDKVLGLDLDQIKKTKIPKEVEKLAKQRLEARNNKNWKESDRLRDEIKKLGFEVEDGKDGYKLRKL